MASILIVDDDDVIREYLELLLSCYRFDTFLASNGVESLEAMDMIRPDLILTDLKMPKMDGYELIRNVRSSASNLPIIAFSGVSDPEVEKKVKMAGGDAFLTKPITENQLINRIKDLLPQIILRRAG